MTDLRRMPLRRWQCSDGCKHLRRRTERPGEAYDCTFWLNVQMTLSGQPHIPQPCGIITAKRITGPHTDEPTRICPHFEEETHQ